MVKEDTYLIRLSDFFSRPFAIDFLYPVFGELSVDTIFNGWIGREIGECYRFENEFGDMLEFSPEGTYVIQSSLLAETFQLRTPKTLGEFIHDMFNYGVQLS